MYAEAATDAAACAERRRMRRARRQFAALWLVHDGIDWLWQGSLPLFLGPLPQSFQLLRGLLVAARLSRQAAGGLGIAPAGVCSVARLARGLQAIYFTPLNDFTYVCVMWTFWALVEAPQSSRFALRRCMGLQVAWIYFASALLKLSPTWLSGSHLWVRQQHLFEHLGWPLPQCLRPLVQSLAVARAEAFCGVAAEAALAALLLHISLRRQARPWCGRLACALALAVHGAGALLGNVWFFGPSMLLQVVLLSRPPPRPSPP